jgi:hypothetical protein
MVSPISLTPLSSFLSWVSFMYCNFNDNISACSL